jgi:hypothetical protein
MAIVAGVLLVVVAAFVARLALRKVPAATVPLFRRLSFRRGTIYSARFAADGKSVIYGAEWDGNPLQLFSSPIDSAESRPFDLPRAYLLSVSAMGELALTIEPTMLTHGGARALSPARPRVEERRATFSRMCSGPTGRPMARICA